MIGRLILGDQLNPQHSWFSQVETDRLCYYLVEAFEELTYAPHHRQKMLGFLGAMRAFSDQLRAQGHSVRYLSVKDRIQDIPAFLQSEKNAGHVTAWEAQEPDEYRLDQALRPIVDRIVSSEHFLTERPDVATHFAGKKTYLMESFYRMMRKKTGILMEGDQPVGGQWNYDADNRQAWPKGHQAPPIPFFSHDLSD